MTEQSFELAIDGVPYVVRVTPFDFNGDLRFRVSYNGGNDNIFVWDSQLQSLRVIDDEGSAVVPSNVETAISQLLQNHYSNEIP